MDFSPEPPVYAKVIACWIFALTATILHVWFLMNVLSWYQNETNVIWKIWYVIGTAAIAAGIFLVRYRSYLAAALAKNPSVNNTPG